MSTHAPVVDITDLPLDAWVVILIHIDSTNLLKIFNTLFKSRAINISLKYKLDTFWIVMSQARYLSHIVKLEKEATFPDVGLYKTSFETLVDMGVPADTASYAVGRAYGDIQGAMLMLGWD